MSDMIMAVVGSTKFTHPDAEHLALTIILHKLEIFEPALVISGGAEGVDTLAERAALGMDIAFKEFPPTFRRWAPHGFQERNDLMAETCTHLLAIRDHKSKNNGWSVAGPKGTFGSGYTAMKAQQLGRNVERIVL